MQQKNGYNRKGQEKIESIVKNLTPKYKAIEHINRDILNFYMFKNKTKEQAREIVKDLEQDIKEFQKQDMLKGRDIQRIKKAKSVLQKFKELILYGERIN